MNSTLDVGDVKRFRDSFQILVKDQSKYSAAKATL